MLWVFICEDNQIQKEKLEKMIENYILIEELDMKIALSTHDPDAVLKEMQENPRQGSLYFLDVDLNHRLDGIALATQIRALDPAGKIVFVTTHGEMALLTFKHKIEALDYIVKDTELEEVKRKIVQCIQIAHERQLTSEESKQNYFIIKVAGRTNFIPLDEIMFVETSTDRNRLILHLENSKIQFRGTIADVENYSQAFVRVHHSVVANKYNVTSIDHKKMEIEFVNGKRAMISVRKLKLLEKALVEVF